MTQENCPPALGNGYRFLEPDEIGRHFVVPLKEIECSSGDKKWYTHRVGDGTAPYYRTKLTRQQLHERRLQSR